MQSLNRTLKRAASGCLTPLALRAAKSYIAGPELADALRVAGRLAGQGFRSTLGYWDGADDCPSSVAQEYLRAIEVLGGEDGDDYLSIKLPALGDSRALLDRILRAARGPAATRIHFDSLAPETADATWAAALAAADAGNTISCTLPGRWRRSIADGETAIAKGILPRVVKGQWADIDGDVAPRLGFMNVIRSLAGRARHVAVASHDVPLAREAVRHLRAAGTSCELELLYGLPEQEAVAMAGEEGVPVRFYVPYGRAYLPYCLGQIRRQPRLLWWLIRDALRTAGSGLLADEALNVFARDGEDIHIERHGAEAHEALGE